MRITQHCWHCCRFCWTRRVSCNSWCRHTLRIQSGVGSGLGRDLDKFDDTSWFIFGKVLSKPIPRTQGELPVALAEVAWGDILSFVWEIVWGNVGLRAWRLLGCLESGSFAELAERWVLVLRGIELVQRELVSVFVSHWAWGGSWWVILHWVTPKLQITSRVRDLIVYAKLFVGSGLTS